MQKLNLFQFASTTMEHSGADTCVRRGCSLPDRGLVHPAAREPARPVRVLQPNTYSCKAARPATFPTTP